jgi:hypothetical protein
MKTLQNGLVLVLKSFVVETGFSALTHSCSNFSCDLNMNIQRAVVKEF